MKERITFIMLFLSVLLIGTGCSSSSEDTGKKKGSASAVVAGTYKGSFSNPDAFNEILTVEDLGSNKIRLSGNNRTPVEMKVQFVSEFVDGDDVMHETGELAGVLIYTGKNRNLNFSGKKTSQDQKLIFFKGTKQ